MTPDTIAIGGDHAGYSYKQFLIDHLRARGYEVRDFGPSSDAAVDYPDFAHPLSEAVSKGEFGLGILICGSGNGVAITANKHADIRAALCWNTELAQLSRQHNKANVLCLPARFISQEEARLICDAFLDASFQGGGRHERRVSKIPC
jgi:ribose 5-phosphate isomerase B